MFSRAAPRVANALDGGDDARVGGVAFDLVAEVGDGDVHGAGFGVGAEAPDLFEKLGAGNGAGLVAVEPAEDAAFARGEGNGLPAALGGAMAEIEVAAVGADGFRLGGDGLEPAGEGVNAGKQFAGAEGLGDIVVGADLEAADFVFLGAAGGEHEDGEAGAGLAEALADGEAVEFGQHEVENDEIQRGIEATFGGGQAVGGDVHLVTGAAEKVHQPGAKDRFVFDNEDVHGAGASVVGGRGRTSKSCVKRRGRALVNREGVE